MKKVPHKLRVEHMPQVPCPTFVVEVTDEHDALRIMNVLAMQHLFLYENHIIPDYCNAIFVTMWVEGEGWVDYYNDDEEMDWEDFQATYLTSAATA
jgi:hypothetical protein